MNTARKTLDPHGAIRVFTRGEDPARAKAAVVLLHGRGSNAADMAGLFDALSIRGLAAAIPEAEGNTWYPFSFLAPIEKNQPYLDSALHQVGKIISDLEKGGIPSERIVLLGFSQGACLATEFVARNPRRYGALIALTGGVIGPLGMPRKPEGSLDGTLVFLGTSDPDPHVPLSRVEETKTLLASMGAKVTLRTYPGMPHTVNQEEIEIAKRFIEKITEDV